MADGQGTLSAPARRSPPATLGMVLFLSSELMFFGDLFAATNPFILLSLVLSFQAAYTGPVVMISQNRQAAKDRDEAEHDYEVNREALERLARLEEEQGRIRELLVDLSVRTRPPGRARQSSREREPAAAATLSPDQSPRRSAEATRERRDP